MNQARDNIELGRILEICKTEEAIVTGDVRLKSLRLAFARLGDLCEVMR